MVCSTSHFFSRCSAHGHALQSDDHGDYHWDSKKGGGGGFLGHLNHSALFHGVLISQENSRRVIYNKLVFLLHFRPLAC
jgi:hypothetical protein